MFKSSFAKYLTAFVIIIAVSFLVLSSIITSMVRTHVTEDKAEKLENTVGMICRLFENNDIENFDAFIEQSNIQSLIALVTLDHGFQTLITNTEGTVLLSTLVENGEGLPSIRGELGSIDPDDFTDKDKDGNGYYAYKGNFGELYSDQSLICARKITSGQVTLGYVVSFVSTVKEDALISVVRTTVFNSSIWVLLAAVIATYFITERIIHPLKVMTGAAKKFGKGDFTERVDVRGRDEVSELAIAFNNMAESLDSFEKMRNSFLASVSHDLRTPMTTISGFIDGITSGAIPPEQHNHYLSVISSEIHRLSRLVTQLLDISRLESGERRFSFTDFDIAEVARLIIISFEKEIEGKHLDVDFVSDEDSMCATADKDAIYQVLYNLVHNAIKFAREQGRLIIKISKNVAKKITVSVYDDGQNVSEEDAAHIFDRFYKTDKSRGLDKSGVGLGLYICKTIIDAHGEEIHLATHTDGCEFWFTLKEGTSVAKQHRLN